MNTPRVYPSTIEARSHVFEPLQPMVAVHGEAGGMQALQAAFSEADVEQLTGEAYEKGVEEGKRLVDQDLTRVVHNMAEAAKRFISDQTAAAQVLQRDALRLSLAVARQVVMSELRSNPDAIADIIAKLLEEAEGRKVFGIRLHPDDIARIRNSPIMHVLEQADIPLDPSEEITPGGCIMETGFGRLDARLETRLEELMAALPCGKAAEDAKEAIP